ncbi:cell division protein FtsQ/DivIB [Ruminococcus flavefaciens]|uniref:POTRA domain-containing protein, FtsQ-type n=1 Tax=Ruminococcus flavefaciens TaxID=1265 RepID=A0A1K1P6X4_RUMFL|nr:FtsQ-type POTRA domain-containing protein [Ruminococcus flavefaciens]SFW43213.1 POTRA domain-containing protein, FtsQ-type [Ruminococcus flavefaciens]
MKDVEKTSVERQNSRRRIRRRQRWTNVYGLVVILLVLTVGITISYTFLFNINEIRVSGQSDMYSAEEIVEASGINKGDNLLRLDCEKSEQRILDKLLYVETAVVDRDFPSSLDITVTKCIPAFNVNYGEGTLLVSKKGKILADNGFITDGLPIIYGFDPADHTPGKPAASENEHKNDAFHELISSMSTKEDGSIMTVDMSDEHAIIVNYKNGMIFKMGNWNDVEYKLNLADTVMQDETVKGKKGYLTMIGTKQCSFRTSDGPVAVPGAEETTTQPMTDEYGFPVIKSEHDPKQEEMLNEFNNNRGTTEPTTAAQQWTDNSGYNDGSQWSDNSYQQDNQWTDNSQWSDDNSWTDQSAQWSDNSGDTANYDSNAVNQW